MLIYEKRFRRYATYRGQIAIKTKRLNGLRYLSNSLIADTTHNFGRINQARSQVFSLGGYIFIFIICLTL